MSARPNTPTRSDVLAGDAVRPLARAKLARFVAALFAGPEAAPMPFGGDAVHDELAAAAEALSLPDGPFFRLVGQPHARAAIADAHNRLLGHTVHSACPPYELEYRRGEIFQQAQTLADIAAFYRAFGFDVAGPLAERPDHVVPECEFLAILAAKEALAAAAAPEHVAHCRDAQRSFLKDHAAAWLPAFFSRLRRADDGGYLAAAADLGEALLNEWCSALSVAVGPEWLDLRPVDDGDMNITCGVPAAVPTVELGPRLAAAMAGR